MLNSQSKSITPSQIRSFQTKKYCTLALLAALAFLCVFFFRIPFSDFLSYEPKDVIIVFASLVYGPVAGIILSIVVSLIEFITISSTGPIGLIMNVLSSVAFILPVAILYKKKKSIPFVILGLVISTLLMTAIMILWNYLITPLYMGIPRDAVVQMLVPLFLPFNLIKGGINSTLVVIMLPLMGILKRLNFIPKSETIASTTKKSHLISIVLATVALSTCILLFLVFNGTI